MEKIDEAIKILQAVRDGKTVEYYVENNNQWQVLLSNSESEIRCMLNNLGSYEWRIQPDSPYRSYVNAEEYLKDSKKHGPFITFKNSNIMQYYLPTAIYDTPFRVRINGKTYNADYIRENYKWQDCATCGILEDESKTVVITETYEEKH